MSLLASFLGIVVFLSAVVLSVVVLLQSPKGGGFAGILGAAGEQAIGTAEAPVRRFTAGVAALFASAALVHSFVI